MSSFQSNQYNQTPTSQSNTRFNNQQQNFQQRNGISLFIKANNVNEELLRSLFNANVSQAKIVSIDVKTKSIFRFNVLLNLRLFNCLCSFKFCVCDGWHKRIGWARYSRSNLKGNQALFFHSFKLILNLWQKLNGKTFQESLFSVSFARPRKPFQRNNSYNPHFQRQPSQIGQSPNESSAFDNTNKSSASSGSMSANANNPPNQGFPISF